MPVKQESRGTKWTRRARKIRRRARRCIDCAGQLSHPESSYCSVCYLKRTATRHLGGARYWPELEALLLQQRNRCAYTGREIILGVNASLEHVEPVSKAPHRARSTSNFRWVVQEVNLAKHSLSMGDFITMCKDVLKHLGWVVTRSKK